MSQNNTARRGAAAVGTVPLLGARAQNAAPMGTARSRTVADIAASLSNSPAATATIIGRPDTVGGRDDNMRLSHRRAAAARDALVDNDHVPADRVVDIAIP